MNAFLEDLDAMVLSTFVVLAVLGIAEWARRRGIDKSVTRKIVHVGIGTWVLPTFLIFEHRLWAVVPPACFVLVNAVSYRTGFIQSVEGGEGNQPGDQTHRNRQNIGTLLYPMSVALALGLFWPEPWPVVGAAAILVMAWGDAAGSLVGRRFGRTHYRVAGHPRSLEGSLAVFGFGVLAILASFAVLGRSLDENVVLAAVLASLGATLAEAVSLWGFDNLLVPATVAIILVLAHGRLWT